MVIDENRSLENCKAFGDQGACRDAVARASAAASVYSMAERRGHRLQDAKATLERAEKELMTKFPGAVVWSQPQ